MKIALTISEDYCPDWDLFCGVREFMQNARDATRVGCTFDAVYLPDSMVIRIKTTGAVLEHRSLLLGESSKRGRTDMLGQQGEGYKIGSLVLCRLGKGVKIRTGEELWVPVIEESKQFGARVLHFDISKGRKNVNEVVVDISGVTQGEWDSLTQKFLFLWDSDREVIPSPIGAVIDGGRGNVFVDGIWVCQMEKFLHGYDFRPSDAQLDRDRRLMDSFRAQTLAAKTWESLYLNSNSMFCDKVDKMLADDAPDVEHLSYEWCSGAIAREKISNRFKAQFGGEALAVATESEAREAEFYGKNAQIVTSYALRSILAREIGTLESVKHTMSNDIVAEHTTMSLSPEESKNFMMAMEFVSKAVARSGLTIMKDISIVEFKSPATMGMRQNNKIYLSRNTLGSFEEALKTLVEEVAHEAGADGTHVHAEAMHTIYASGIAEMLKVSGSEVLFREAN